MLIRFALFSTSLVLFLCALDVLKPGQIFTKFEDVGFSLARALKQREYPLIKSEAIHHNQVGVGELLRIGRRWLKRVNVNPCRNNGVDRHGVAERKLGDICEDARRGEHDIVGSV